MNTQTMFLVMLLMIVALGMWQSRRMKTMVHCYYTSRSKQGFDKLVREKDGYAIFEGKKFHLLPAYAVQEQYSKGLSSFFPTKISAYSYSWNSDIPIDPNTGVPAMLTPEVMNKLRQEGAMLSYTGSQNQALSSSKSKLGGFDKWMPYIMIVLVLAVVYCIYMTYQMNKDQTIIKTAISDIFNKIGIK
jgi:hypothetical protein